MTARRAVTRTGGRPATTGTIAGDFALSVGAPDRPAPEGWRWKKITDVARLETGHTPSRKHPEYWGGDIPWIGIKDATRNHGRTIYDTIQHTNELGIANSSARILPEHTVCVSRTASVGYVVVMGRSMATSQDFVNWVTSPELDHRFLKYVLLSEQSAFLRFASGTTHQTIYFPEVKAFHICIPSTKEQGAISYILQKLDDKIELNRRMNQTLEAMARALFKSWFVDFDPVRAKAALKHHDTNHSPLEGESASVERARAYLDSMDPNIAALFPDRFVDSELGPIPAGWEVKALVEAMEINPPRSLRKGEIAPYLDMANMPTKDHTPDKVIDRPFGSGMRFINGDTLVARITPCLENGKTAYVDFLQSGEVGWGSTEYIVVRPKPPLPNEFAYCLARSGDFREFAIQNMTGTSGRQRVPATAISNYKMTVPNGLGVPKIFGELIEPLFSLASQNADESRTLATLRDTLLPKLISGEVRIKAIAPLGRMAQLAR